MIYADYDFYRNEYYGRAVPAADYPRLALRGSQYIDYITRGRAAANADLEAVRMCCCALVERYHLIDAAQQARAESLSDEYVELQSESVGGWSRSFGSTADMADAVARSAQEEIAGIVRQYLANTGLLYRGRC